MRKRKLSSLSHVVGRNTPQDLITLAWQCAFFQRSPQARQGEAMDSLPLSASSQRAKDYGWIAQRTEKNKNCMKRLKNYQYINCSFFFIQFQFGSLLFCIVFKQSSTFVHISWPREFARNDHSVARFSENSSAARARLRRARACAL